MKEMSKQILINIEPTQRRVAVLENGSLSNFFIERMAERRIAGNIYKGKVKSVVSGIQAAFIHLGLAKQGFLYLDEIIFPAPVFADEYYPEKKITKESISSPSLFTNEDQSEEIYPLYPAYQKYSQTLSLLQLKEREELILAKLKHVT